MYMYNCLGICLSQVSVSCQVHYTYTWWGQLSLESFFELVSFPLVSFPLLGIHIHVACVAHHWHYIHKVNTYMYMYMCICTSKVHKYTYIVCNSLVCISHVHVCAVLEMGEELSEAIKKVWADAGVQECYQRRNEYQLSDSTK